MAKRARINDVPVLITNPKKSDIEGYVYFWVIGAGGVKKECHGVPETLFNSKKKFEHNGKIYLNTTVD